MPTEDIDLGVQASWMVPMVGKGERIEVCFEIKGSGEVDGDILNKFHGVHFGDEIESDELPETNVEEVAEEAEEDAESSEAEAPKVTWREDVLLRVMKSHDISVDDRDAFVAHAVNFAHDDNGYLKKAELEDAAKAWSADSTEEAVEEATEEAVEEATEAAAGPEETEESNEKVCPVCSANTPADAISCASCGWTFES